MKKRIITALILAFILLPAAIMPSLYEVFQILLIIFTIIGAVELLNMYDKEKKVTLPIKILAVLLTLVLYSAILNRFKEAAADTLIIMLLDRMHLSEALNPATALIGIFIVLMSAMVFVKDFDVKDIGKLYTSIIYVGVGAGALTVLRFYGVRLMVYVLLMAMITDIFALVFGMTLGKHKMAPNISPKKTWEGAIGGTCVAVIVGFLFLYFYPSFSSVFHDGLEIEFFHGIFNYDIFTKSGKIVFLLGLSLALSVCGQIGDLIASKLKRAYGIKDYSNIFPGHGGVLDRFDSTFFASAIFLLFIIIESGLFPC